MAKHFFCYMRGNALLCQPGSNRAPEVMRHKMRYFQLGPDPGYRAGNSFYDYEPLSITILYKNT